MSEITMADEHKEYDLATLWELLHTVDKKLDLHMQQYAINAPKVDELVQLLDRSKGILIFLTWASVIASALGAMFLWLKDHIK